MDTVNLVKAKAEVMTVNLAKKGITTIPTMRVLADLDVSGSMSGLYRNGTVEKAFEKLLGLAFKFDDNGEIDMVVFDTTAHALPTAKVADYGSYVTRNITSQWNRYGGGTSYGQPLQANMDFLFGEEKPKGLFGMFKKGAQHPANEPPALVLFFTDGDPSDGDAAARIIKAAQDQDRPVYFHLIGMGTATRFPTLQRLADDYDNCGFINLHSIDMSDDDLYRELTTDEFVAFLKKHGAK
jgi:uncharacterized protein YegL